MRNYTFLLRNNVPLSNININELVANEVRGIISTANYQQLRHWALARLPLQPLVFKIENILSKHSSDDKRAARKKWGGYYTDRIALEMDASFEKLLDKAKKKIYETFLFHLSDTINKNPASLNLSDTERLALKKLCFLLEQYDGLLQIEKEMGSAISMEQAHLRENHQASESNANEATRLRALIEGAQRANSRLDHRRRHLELHRNIDAYLPKSNAYIAALVLVPSAVVSAVGVGLLTLIVTTLSPFFWIIPAVIGVGAIVAAICFIGFYVRYKSLVTQIEQVNNDTVNNDRQIERSTEQLQGLSSRNIALQEAQTIMSERILKQQTSLEQHKVKRAELLADASNISNISSSEAAALNASGFFANGGCSAEVEPPSYSSLNID